MENEIIKGLFAVLITVLSLLYGNKGVQNVKQNKHDNLTNKLEVAEKIANFVIPEMAQRKDLVNSMKMKQAVIKINQKLNKIGLNISEDTIFSIAEKVYQEYKNSGGDIHKFENNMIKDSVDTIEDKVVDKKDIENPEQKLVNQDNPNPQDIDIKPQGKPYDPYNKDNAGSDK